MSLPMSKHGINRAKKSFIMHVRRQTWKRLADDANEEIFIMKKQLLMILLVCMVVFSASFSAFADDDRPRLGLTVEAFEASPILLQHLKLAPGEGVMIRNIAVGGDLEAAGLSQGDILLAIDGHTMSSPQDVVAYIENLPQNTKVTLDVIQKGDHIQINATLDSLPDDVTWKYVEPIPHRGRRSQMSPMRQAPMMQPGFSGGVSSTQKLMFRSAIQTSQGMVMSAVTISGDPNDPESEIEITLGDKKYVSKIGEIDALPDDARQAAQQAIAHSGQFSFTFGFGANNSMIEEMIRRQQEEMDAFEQMFSVFRPCSRIHFLGTITARMLSRNKVL